MTDPLFLAYLAQHGDEAWYRVVDRLERAIHPVDRAATLVWFRFFPMRLQQAIEQAREPAVLEAHLRLEGRWRLADQRDTSHWFLFGHRYWDDVCDAVRTFAKGPVAPGSLDLAAQIQGIARAAGQRLHVDPSWLVGITAVAVRTLQQVGLSTPPGHPGHDRPASVVGAPGEAADRLLSRRLKDNTPGLLGFLRGRRRTWNVTFDERPPVRSFPLIDSQHLTTAAALDTRDYRSGDPRCTEGPIPAQCRSCSCGTCWVGILAGADCLSPVEERERVTMSALGYVATSEAQPVVRLACMAEARASVTLVIPPWNGQIGTRLDRALRDP